MMRRARTVKPEFFTSEDVLALPIPARLTFVGLLLYVDDFGNGSAHPGLVRADVYPLDDDMTVEVVEDHLLLLADRGMVTFYEVAGRQLLRITNWEKHQRVDRPSRSNIPADPGREDPANEGGEGGEGERERQAPESVEEAVSGEGEGDEGEPSRPMTEPAREGHVPPSPFCSAHPSGTPKACKACGNARMVFKRWQISREMEIEDGSL